MKILKYGLVGNPLKHSLSKILHTRLFDILKQPNSEYELFEVTQKEFADNIDFFRKLDGFNITSPYKTEINNFIDLKKDEAIIYNSINTVKKDSYDKLVGYNTDIFGIKHIISKIGNISNKNILILGYGATGSMILKYLKNFSKNIDIAVSSTEKAKILNGQTEFKFIFSDSLEPIYDIIINATPVGAYPNKEDIPLSECVVKNCENVVDLIYNPIETKLIKIAKRNNIKTQNGLEMLIIQAFYSQKIWFNREINYEYSHILEIKRYLQDAISNFN